MKLQMLIYPPTESGLGASLWPVVRAAPCEESDALVHGRLVAAPAASLEEDCDISSAH
jgi:hypothetical protein